MLSAVSAQGELRFMVHEGTATAEIFRIFLKTVNHVVDNKILLIVDGHRIHRAKKVQALLKQLDGKITLFRLPRYSPQLNPDKRAWKRLKQRVAKQTVGSRAQLKPKAVAALLTLQRPPETIRGFFLDPDCAYAAAGK
jgi:transposase